ncbi:unnamed protein product [Dracunculus medinensis]|uniref:Orphan sodium-and chloride-dependent neurotransmitter transporter NTT5 n=1 Tax=Dracunculus medinensis TaxID=318479 RepID=A0A0N4U312_DRAME|nr:unnamed protein product [Dracunculus medinensis]
MQLSAETIDAYSIAILSSSYYSHLLSQSVIIWPIILVLFTLPSLNLLINLGYVSGYGQILTFQRISPISSGLGWSLTWLAGEKLFLQSLTAAQYLLYIIYSLRLRLNWALDCDNYYNNGLCTEFLKENVSHGYAQHQPDNNWPAQQFNRYAIRGVPLMVNITEWIPNAWYFPDINTEKFSLEIPPMFLTVSHITIWISLFFILYRYGMSPGWFLIRFCFLLPSILFIIIVIGLFICGLTFTNNNEKEILPENIEKYPFVYFSDIHGFFRTTMVLMDYSSAFTGIIVFASSRIRSNSMPINPIALLSMQMVGPVFLYILRRGCNGHLAKVQPAYDSYIATDATFSFDTAAVCFATISGGPLWAILYYTANLLFTCIGPMVVLLLFIHNAFLEQFPFIQRYSSQILGLLCGVFLGTGFLLCMPLGTSFGTLLQYVSQSSISHIFLFIVVFFIYGWYDLDADVRLMLGSPNFTSLLSYLSGPLSPFYTILLFTSVPALLAAKFASVFDLLMGGLDILKHIDYGTNFMTSSQFINRLFGYGIMLAPTFIIIIFALFHFWRNTFIYKLPIGSMLDATSDWKSHISIRQINVTRIPPLSHRIYTSLTKISYRTVLFAIFIVEMVIGITILILFFRQVFFDLLDLLYVLVNALYAQLHSSINTGSANSYRTILLLVFSTFHILAMFEMKWALQKWDHSSRLNLYIAVATMEMAFLNGYMWMFAVDHSWGLLFSPFMVIVVNTITRGVMIAIVVGIRWNIAEKSYPTRTRDVTEIYDATADLDNYVDRDDDTPIIYEMRRDVFT